MKRLLSLAATLLLIFSIAASAQAQSVFNWGFDFSSLGSASQITRIDRLQFEARARLFTSRADITQIQPGDRFIAQGIGIITAFLPTTGSDPVQGSLGTVEQITFYYATEGSFTTTPTGPTGVIGFNHANNDIGFAKMYFDTTPNGGGTAGNADFATGLGFGDGTLIADLDGINKDVGNINFSFSGGDRADFAFVDVLTGIWRDNLLNDLEATLEPTGTSYGLGITDNNFDLPDPFEDALAYNDIAWASYFSGIDTTGYTLQPFTLTEDGSFELHVKVVPEPSTIMLSGLGLLGLGFLVRRRHGKQS